MEYLVQVCPIDHYAKNWYYKTFSSKNLGRTVKVNPWKIVITQS